MAEASPSAESPLPSSRAALPRRGTHPRLYPVGIAIVLFGVACFLAVGLVPRLSLSTASDLETIGAAVLFLGLVVLAFAAGAFRPWRESTAMGAYRFWSGAPIGGSVVCPVCEAPNEEGTRYCVRCGRELPPAT